MNDVTGHSNESKAGARPGVMRRFGRFIGKIFRVNRDTRHTPGSRWVTPAYESRQPTESEIDEAERESFPASDPPALSLEASDGNNKKGHG